MSVVDFNRFMYILAILDIRSPDSQPKTHTHTHTYAHIHIHGLKKEKNIAVLEMLIEARKRFNLIL